MQGMRFGGRRAIAGWTAAAVVLIGSWLVATQTATDPPADSCAIHLSAPADSPSQRTADMRVEVVTDKLALLSPHDAAYEGIAVALPKLIICIYRTSAASAVAERDYRALVPTDIELQFEPALLTARQEGQLQALIGQRQQWLIDHGVQVSAYGANGQGGPYFIGYAEWVRPSDALLQPFEIFGRGTVVFKYEAFGSWT